MNLVKKKPSKKQIKSNKKVNKQTKNRVLAKTNPNTQTAIKYTSQFEEGLMHIVGKEYSTMYKMGELDYEVSTENEQLNTVMGYAEALNSLDKNSRYQLLVINKRVKGDVLEDILYDYEGNPLDIYRDEINHIIEDRYKKDERNFVVEKYAIFTNESKTAKQSKNNLEQLAKNFMNRFDSNGIDLSMKHLGGEERLKVMAGLLMPNRHFSMNYQDIAISGLNSKSFIVPDKIKFPNNRDYFRLGNKYGRIFYIRKYPKYLEDTLIKELCDTGIELAISIHAKPYDMQSARKNLQTIRTLNNSDIQKQQKQNFKSGISDDMISGEAAEIKESTTELLAEIKDNGQKLYTGLFTVFIVADSEQELEDYSKAVIDTGNTWQIDFDSVEAYKEEALNTVLPIGKPYLDVEQNYVRDMTTSNIVTQVPFTNIEIQSESPHALYYGQNQLTNNMITIDRKTDLITPSGLILGSSGSGKGMTVKWEIENVLLKYPNERIIIVDPEGEYTPLAKVHGAQILDISTGTNHHLNLLELPDESLLDEEDQNLDLVKEKVNLLSSLFESRLKTFTDMDAAIIDRVTRLTYLRFERMNRKPTLVDWHDMLLSEGERDPIALELATKVEPYTKGSQDIFAYETNIDLNSRFVIFNIKKLDEHMKPFAMKIILDQVWKQVVNGQKKVNTHLYFDELQLNFSTESSAHWFMELWSRIRKYGSIPTGITQDITTLLDSPAGRKMIMNSEFIVLLRQKTINLERLKEIMTLTPKLLKFVNERVTPGTGLISSGGIIVPFENPIPEDTHLYEIMNTDA